MFQKFIWLLLVNSEVYRYITCMILKQMKKVKETIRNDMSSDGLIRVLICTYAAGMGVNFKGVHDVFIMDCPGR